MAAILDGWELASTVLVGMILLGLIVFSILKPSGRVRIGMFFEREHFHDDPADEDTKEWPTRKE